MSDTPRTDKARGAYDLDTCVFAEDMQELERELNAAKAENEAMLDAIKEATLLIQNGVLNPMAHPSGKPAMLKEIIAKLQPFLK